ncbi:hypothetical protein [Polyangium sp. y55x31]|uniref:hypothetical protein n=1 Tax=Polyangium sp. y55x31 TaxID=3042688 RepID=UPI0024823E09|nr:hypothetical protein [Polyangium sp. y55x31]MDI1476291.1 hypothetical protein [Polyangium sp. y55x31]
MRPIICPLHFVLERGGARGVAWHSVNRSTARRHAVIAAALFVGCAGPQPQEKHAKSRDLPAASTAPPVAAAPSARSAPPPGNRLDAEASPAASNRFGAEAPPPPSKVEAEALARAADAAGPRVRLFARPSGRFTPEGAALGSRGAGPWKQTPFLDLAIAERREGRIRVVVDVEEEGEAGPEPTVKGVGHLIPILHTFRLLFWVDEASVGKVLARDVELRPVARGSARPKGWDATISVRVGTPCEQRETRGDEVLIAVPFHGGTISGWVDLAALDVVFDPARASAASRAETRGKRRFVASGTLHIGKDGPELVRIRHADVVLRGGGAWSRVEVSNGGKLVEGNVTVSAWIQSSELAELPLGGPVRPFALEVSALDGRSDLPRRSIPKGTLLRDPVTRAVVGIAMNDAKLAVDAEGGLWAPTVWGPVAVLAEASAAAP